MSATLGVLIKQLEPSWTIRIVEKLSDVAQESSSPWNNAGTGHAGLCELNYMPEAADGSLEASKALVINEQFQLSRQFWAHLVDTNMLDTPTSFINPTPHMTFVWGQKNVDYLRRRTEVLKNEPLFAGFEFTEDPEVIAEWSPLIMKGRQGNQPVAATRIVSGTDVDYGALTRQLMSILTRSGAELMMETDVRSIRRRGKASGEFARATR